MGKQSLSQRIVAASFLKGNFLLRSGKRSDFYLDKYRFEADPDLLQLLAAEMEKRLPPTFDKLAGLELGGIPLATALAIRTGRPCLFVRKQAKEYGTRNLVEGGFDHGATVVVIEDVITTAGQVVKSVTQMRALGLRVENAICVIDRQEGGSENLRGIDVSLASVFTMSDLRPAM